MVGRRARRAGGVSVRPSWPPPALFIAALLCGVAAGACEITDVAIPGGESVVVVHAVMRPDRSKQYVIVERGYDGVRAPEGSFAPLPVGPPQVPITGATVTVTNLDQANDPCGATVFNARPGPGYFTNPGSYWGPSDCPSMRPGDRLALRVETPAAEVVTGETVVPGLTGATVTLHGITQPAGVDTLVFNRDRDTLGLTVVGTFFRAMPVEVRRVVVRVGLPPSQYHRTLLTFADTNAIQIPGTIRDLYDDGAGNPTFLGGHHYLVVTGVADRNYFDFARSRNDDLTGRGFVNRLTGGIGLFGSMVTVAQPVMVEADVDDPREGTYHLSGLVDTTHVDVTLDLYLARAAEQTEVSGFLRGAWIQRVLSADGVNPPSWGTWQQGPLSVDGQVSGDSLELTVPTRELGFDGLDLFNIVLRGRRIPGAAFSVSVQDSLGFNVLHIGTLTATQAPP